MKRFIAGVVVLLAAGCGQNGIKLPERLSRMAHHAEECSGCEQCDKPGAVEEFVGVVDLFDAPLKARRQMILNENGDWVKQGKATAYYENGQKAGEMAFKNDKPDGKTLAWFESGKKKMQGQSVDGVACGTWTEWYENGQVESKGDYVEGERHGNWQFWKPDGEMLETVEYRGGKKIGVVENPGDTLSR